LKRGHNDVGEIVVVFDRQNLKGHSGKYRSAS
jgi:hypothetical protein